MEAAYDLYGRTVGDAQVSEVRYDVRHMEGIMRTLEGRGCTTRPPGFVISSALPWALKQLT